VVCALRMEGRNWSRYGYIIEEARWVLFGLQSWKINHVKRQLNSAVHCLTKEALSLSFEHGFIEDVPYCISDIIYVERCA
jgi:hypothetical protein